MGVSEHGDSNQYNCPLGIPVRKVQWPQSARGRHPEAETGAVVGARESKASDHKQ